LGILLEVLLQNSCNENIWECRDVATSFEYAYTFLTPDMEQNEPNNPLNVTVEASLAGCGDAPNIEEGCALWIVAKR